MAQLSTQMEGDDQLIIVRDYADLSQGYKLLSRTPLVSGNVGPVGDCQIRLQACYQDGERTRLDLELTGTPNALDALGRYCFVIRYADGHCGSHQSGKGGSHAQCKLTGFPLRQHTHKVNFHSPLLYPWNTQTWTQLIQGAELLMFQCHSVKIQDKPQKQNSSSVAMAPVSPPPPLTENSTAKEIQSYVDAWIDHFQSGGASKTNSDANAFEKLSSEAVPTILANAPFGTRAWGNVLPFLMKHSTEAHLPQLEKLLQRNPDYGLAVN